MFGKTSVVWLWMDCLVVKGFPFLLQHITIVFSLSWLLCWWLWWHRVGKSFCCNSSRLCQKILGLTTWWLQNTLLSGWTFCCRSLSLSYLCLSSLDTNQYVITSTIVCFPFLSDSLPKTISSSPHWIFFLFLHTFTYRWRSPLFSKCHLSILLILIEFIRN